MHKTLTDKPPSNVYENFWEYGKIWWKKKGIQIGISVNKKGKYKG
jgi:hypothetical protein